MSPDIASQISTWRAKAAEGELSVEDMRKVVELIRGDRKTAATSISEKAKKVRAKKEIKSADDMLSELGL